MRPLIVWVVLTFAAAGSAGAEPGACDGAPFRAFDFWVGEWLVRLPDGTPAGTNRITVDQGGCVLIERWLGASGTTGTSISHHDPATGRWHQHWVSPDTLIELEGVVVDGTLAMEGSIVYIASAEKLAFRGSWTPLADGRVRQRFDEQRDGSWQPWFEGYYERITVSR